MAFKVLSDEEKQFLDEESLRVYNEEYEIYLERNKFVDRLEAIGKVEKQEFKPQLKRLKPIGSYQEKKYELPKAEGFKISNDIVIKECSDLPHDFVLPELSVYDNNIKVAEASDFKNEIQTEFSLSDIPEIKDYKIETIGFKMPDITASEVNTDVAEVEPVNYEKTDYTVNGTENIKRDYKVVSYNYNEPENEKPVLDTAIPDVPTVNEFELPDYHMADVVQPEISSFFADHDFSVDETEEGKYYIETKKPVLDTEIPEVPAVNKFELPEYSMTGVVQPKINEGIAEHNFSVPEFSAEMPDINIAPQVKIASFEAEKPAVSDMPEIDVCQFSAPEYKKVQADTASIPNIKIEQFKKPDVFKIDDSEVDLPDVEVDDFGVKSFVMPEIEKVTLNTDVKSISEIDLNFKVEL